MSKDYLKILSFAGAFIFLSGPSFSAEQSLDWERAQKEVKQHLINLINIKTALPEGNEIEAVRYIYRVLNREKIDWSIFRPEEKRASIAAYLKGDGSEKPLVLLSHLDTVGAVPEEWTVNPFKATEKDDSIYGRGASDCKDLVSIELAAMVMLKRSGIKLNRDVIMLATADEEAGGYKGLRWLLETHWDKIQAGFAINQGGGMILDEKSVPKMIFVETAEKMYLDIKMTARGSSAHSAVAPREHAIYKLARALEKIQAHRFPLRVNDTAKQFFKSIYPLQDQDAKTTLDMLFSPDPKVSAQAAEAVSMDPFFNSQLRDTVTPTIISGGYANNVVPGEASAVLNCRLLPDSDLDKFISELKGIIDDDEVSLVVLEEPRVPFPKPMSMDDKLFEAIAGVSQSLFPGAVVAGGLVSGSPGTEFLRRKGVIAYGLGGAVAYGNSSRAHTVDERISERELYQQFKFIYSLVRNFAASKSQ